MKDLQSLNVELMKSHEIVETNAGWADSTNDGMYGEGGLWTGGGSADEGYGWFVDLVLLISELNS